MSSKIMFASFAVLAGLSLPVMAEQQPSLNSRDPIVAKVGSQTVRRSDVFDYIRMTSPRLAADPETLTKIFPKMVRDITTRMATVKKAREMKLDQTVEVKKMKQECESGVLHQAYLFQGLKDSFPEEELKKEFDLYKKDFVIEDQYQTSHILVKTEKEAKDIIARLKMGEDFAALAKLSEDPGSKEKGGDLGFIGKNDVPGDFGKVLSELKEGAYTETPVKTDFGYHVILRGKSRKSEPAPYEKVKADVLPLRLIQKKVLERIQKAREEAKIEEFNIDGSPLSQAASEAFESLSPFGATGGAGQAAASSTTNTTSETSKTAPLGTATGAFVGSRK